MPFDLLALGKVVVEVVFERKLVGLAEIPEKHGVGCIQFDLEVEEIQIGLQKLRPDLEQNA